MRCVDCVLLHEQRGGTYSALACTSWICSGRVCYLVCAADAEVCCDRSCDRTDRFVSASVCCRLFAQTKSLNRHRAIRIHAESSLFGQCRSRSEEHTSE